MSEDRWPLGIFVSVGAGRGATLAVARELGVPTIQLHAPPAAERTTEAADCLRAQLAEMGLRVSVVFAGFAGESYADIPTYRRTVGLVPPEYRPVRLAELREIIHFAHLLGVDAVGLHVGFIPEEPNDPLRRELVAVVQEVCDFCRTFGQRLHLETGQETADTLLSFMREVGRENLFVNFDPANMILYGSGEPLAALVGVGSYVRSVHCKDAVWAKRPGVEWGREVPLGEGDVGIAKFLRTLHQIGYFGPLTVEREIPHEPARQKVELARALQLLEMLKTQLLR